MEALVVIIVTRRRPINQPESRMPSVRPKKSARGREGGPDSHCRVLRMASSETVLSRSADRREGGREGRRSYHETSPTCLSLSFQRKFALLLEYSQSSRYKELNVIFPRTKERVI